MELDDSNSSIAKKVRNAQLNQYNYVIVLGDEEAASNQLAIRSRDDGKQWNETLETFVDRLKSEYPPGVPLPRPLKTK